VYHLVHAAAHEHGAASDVYGAHGVGEQHDRQDEPGRGFTDSLLRDAAYIVADEARSLSTMAAAFQKEMNDSITVVLLPP